MVEQAVKLAIIRVRANARRVGVIIQSLKQGEYQGAGITVLTGFANRPYQILGADKNPLVQGIHNDLAQAV